MKKNIFMWIVIFIAIVIVFLFPNIYNFVSNFTIPKSGNGGDIPVKEEVQKVTEEVLSSIHFPLMRNSKYSINTYYSLDVFKSNDMNNVDKLYSAFTNLENVSIENNTFKSAYMDLLIDNVLGKDVDYNLEAFYVPLDSASIYKGYWMYNPNTGLFWYKGGTNNENTSIEYYDLTSLKSAEYDKKDIIAYYYILFAKVVNNNYVIYSDPGMTNVVTEGTLTDTDLNTVFNSIDNSKKKVYKFVFKNTICSYSEYCLYEGSWVED